MKGKISPNLEKILRDERGRKLLRRALFREKDGEITVGSVTYHVTTKSVDKSALAERFASGKTVQPSRRAAG